MPRIKPPRAEALLPEPQDHTPPTEDIEIALSDDVSGDTEIDLVAAPPTPEPALAPAHEPAPAPGEDALVRAAEATRRAEELQRRNAVLQQERDEATRRATDGREEVEQAQYDSLLGHISAQQQKLESSRAALRAAKASGDVDAEIDATEQMTDAKSELNQLEAGKRAFDSRREKPPATEPRAPAAPTAPQDFEGKLALIPGVPEAGKAWLRKHPEFVNDTAMNNKIGATHNYLTQTRGVEPFSQAYFDALDTEFGFKTAAPAPSPEPQPQPQNQRRSIPMTAPVSRDVPTPSGQRAASSKITLTAEERQIARTSFTDDNMTNEQKELLYARNKAKLIKMRANGEYRNTTEQTG